MNASARSDHDLMNTDPTPTFDDLVELGKRATAGPWETYPEADDYFGIWRPEEVPGAVGSSALVSAAIENEADSEFIVTARNLWEPLLAVAEAAEAWRYSALLTRQEIADNLKTALDDLDAAIRERGNREH